MHKRFFLLLLLAIFCFKSGVFADRCVPPVDFIMLQNTTHTNYGTVQTQGAFIDGLNSAMYFEGTSSYIDYGPLTISGALSFSFWAKVEEMRNGARIIDFGQGRYEYNIVIMINGDQCKFIEMKGNNWIYRAPDRIQQFGPQFGLNVWEQYTITVAEDGQDTRIYKNGVYGNDETNPGNQKSAGVFHVERTKTFMGKSNFANDPFFKGSIDGFRIYDRVLSPEEANCLGNKINYCRRQCGSCSPDYDTCSTCSGSNRDASKRCFCSDGYYDIGKDECKDDPGCEDKHPLLKILSYEIRPTYQRGFFSTSELDTLLGNTNWDTKSFDIVNVRNGERRQLSFVRNSSGNSHCTVQQDYDFYFQNGDLVDFQKYGCQINTHQWYLEENNESLFCNNFKCARCVNNQDNCTMNCGTTCRTCQWEAKCTSCHLTNEYIAADYTCKLCEVQCGTCETTGDNCLTCSDDPTRDFSQQCACITQHFQDGNNAKCGKCDHQCDECETTKDNCKACSHSTRNSVNNCMCNDGYYNVGTNAECQKCDETKCGTCNSLTTCIKPCDNTCKTCGTDGKCLICEEIGEFLENGECKPCAVQCKKCSGSATHCTECSDLTTRQFDNNKCSCKTQRFQDGNNILCEQCNSQCNECEVNANQCKACYHNTRNENDSCNCNPGYFHVSGQNECAQCDTSKCATCNNINTCTLECDSTCKTCGTDGKCLTCEDIGEFLDNGECKPCAVQCKKCSGTSDYCIECSDLTTREFNNNTCSCKIKYFQDGINTLCGKCDPKCEQCSGTKDTCQGCSHQTRDPDNNCQCLPGYYNVGQNEACSMCDHTKCATCDGSPDNCTKLCNPGCIACDYTGNCSACNPVGEYYKDSQCHNCEAKCESCQDSAGNCITCSDSNRDDQLNCSCKHNYFEDGVNNPICGKCHHKCNGCQGSSDNCSSCSHETRDPDNNCECKKGYYNDLENQECQRCNSKKCATCTSFDVCILPCDSSCLYCNLEGKCLNCNIGWYLEKGLCQQCDKKCLTCEKSGECTTCSGLGLGRDNDIDTQCGCSEGYYEQENSLDCVKCEIKQCKNCNKYGQCIQCMNPYLRPPLCKKPVKQYYLDQSITDNMQQIEINFNKCSPQCLQCTEKPENCTQCVQGRFRDPQPPCLCQYGYYDNNGSSNNCTKCPQLCGQCSGSVICHKCENSEGVDLNPTSGLCECKVGYKFNKQTGNCQKCFMYKGQCLSKCPPELYQNEQSLICQQLSIMNQFSEYIQDQENKFLQIVILCTLTGIALVLIFGVFWLKELQQKIISSGINQSLQLKKQQQIIQDKEQLESVVDLMQQSDSNVNGNFYGLNLSQKNTEFQRSQNIMNEKDNDSNILNINNNNNNNNSSLIQDDMILQQTL